MHCAWPNCDQEGTFRAPKDPRKPRDWQYFCQAHIKEFNKGWNGLSGFSEDEVFSMQNGGNTFQRPTWNMGVNGAKVSADPGQLFANAQDLYSFFQQRLKTEQKAQAELPSTLHLPADVKEACVIFNLPQPDPDATHLKKRYLSLVKQHHPDVNKSADAPEQIKRINVAYRILTDYAQRRP